MKRDELRMYIAMAAVAGLGIWWMRNAIAGAASGAWGAVTDGPTVRSAIGGFGGYVSDVGAGVVEGIGMAVGIPRTSMTQCQRDQAAGDHWAASFSCPALDFLGGLWPSTQVQQATQADVRRVDNALGRPAGADVFYTPYGTYGGI